MANKRTGTSPHNTHSHLMPCSAHFPQLDPTTINHPKNKPGNFPLQLYTQIPTPHSRYPHASATNVARDTPCPSQHLTCTRANKTSARADIHVAASPLCETGRKQGVLGRTDGEKGRGRGKLERRKKHASALRI